MYDPMLGQTIDGLTIIEQLAIGNVGIVYIGQGFEGNKVAIKVIGGNTARNTNIKNRFLREVEVIASLKHSNIASLLKAGETNLGEMYLVMPLYEGQTLAEKIQVGALPINEALDYAKQIAQGLQYAHWQGIIHRDIKPANVFLTTEKNIKILDFGVAKLNGAIITKTGMIVGTMCFMAPEQIEGKPASFKTDIWAWGLTFFKMLTGRSAFEAKGMKVMFAIMNEEPQKLTNYLPESLISDSLQSILDKALAKLPTERYSSFKQVLEDIEKAAVKLKSNASY